MDFMCLKSGSRKEAAGGLWKLVESVEMGLGKEVKRRSNEEREGRHVDVETEGVEEEGEGGDTSRGGNYEDKLMGEWEILRAVSGKEGVVLFSNATT